MYTIITTTMEYYNDVHNRLLYLHILKAEY